MERSINLKNEVCETTDTLKGATLTTLRSPAGNTSDTKVKSDDHKDHEDADDLSVMTYKELQKICKVRGLKTYGKGDALRSRLLDSSVKSKGISVASVANEKPEKHDADADADADADVGSNADDVSIMSYRQLQQACKSRGL